MSVVVVGNPKPLSRTRRAAEVVTERVMGTPPDAVVDLCELGSELMRWDGPRVVAAKETVKSAGDLLVVASPTYKGSYTGLLKLFLDTFGAGELKGQVTVPLMLGAALQHAMAPELVLRPVLVEIGASCPWPGLYLLDSEFESGPLLEGWLSRVHSAQISADGRERTASGGAGVGRA